jgi:chromate transporter
MSKPGDLITLFWTFGVTSLFAIGGAAAAIPEFYRIAVEQHHWMTDGQFADLFAISQLSPGPNILIVTLIGYHVAGILGGITATLAMCGPTAILSYAVSRILHRASDASWPALVQAALVPLSIGLMCASAYVLAQTVDRNGIAIAFTIGCAILIWRTKINPLWLLAAGAALGFAGIV